MKKLTLMMTYGLLKKKKFQKKFPKQEASERDADTGKYKQLQEAIPCT